jgi:hypothetical protein
MLFATEEDAREFDTTLKNIEGDTNFRRDFEKVIWHYASLGSVQRAINQGEFHYGLVGNKTAEPLLKAIENMVSGKSGLDPDDKYREPMTYLLNLYYPNE